ncbi:MAG: hypothetical protein M1819_000654 [Sarea resinae]|nr:MAG: hypothetical protein M1819_000654 [Sarea resinae]
MDTLPMAKPRSSYHGGASVRSRCSDETPATLASDTPATSYHLSSISDGSGFSTEWKDTTQSHPSPSSRSSKMMKIKSISTHGVASMSREPSAHGKLHKRTNSASPPAISNSPDTYSTTTPNFPEYNESTPGQETPLPRTTSSGSLSKTKTKIKPFIRRFTPRESNSLDLSRSVTENGDLLGLGIYGSDTGTGPQTAADVAFVRTGRTGGPHNRSTSGASQYSDSSSVNQKSGSQYIHPMRQRPHSPPRAQSYPLVTGDDDLVQEREEYQDHLPRDRPFRSSTWSTPRPNPPLRVRTSTGSANRLLNGSQPNLTGTASLDTSGETLRSSDTISPLSRPSLDLNFKIRSREPLDAAERAASIRAARKAFSEKEAAKARKAEEEEMRHADRQLRKEHRRRSEGWDRPKAKTSGESEKAPCLEANEPTERPQPSGYHTQKSEPISEPSSPRARPSIPATRAAKSRWIAFLTWLRMKLYRLGKKTHLAV